MDIHDIGFNVFLIEGSTVPFDEMAVFLMSWIGDCVEEYFEARGAADIFRWRAPLAAEEGGEARACRSIENVDDLNMVFPVISHIVGIEELFDATVAQFHQARGTGIVDFASSKILVERDAVTPAGEFELLKVAVEPQECRLDGFVQALEGHRERYFDLAPGRRIEIHQCDA